MVLANRLCRRSFWYNQNMKRRKKKAVPERPVFDSIRKPTAPPTQKFGREKPDEKIHPSQRKAKYKQDPEIDQ